MDISTLIGSSGALGGVFGAMGSGLGRLIGIYEMREKRQDRTLEMAHEKERWAHDNERVGLQIQARAADTDNALKLGVQALDHAALEGSWTGLKASVQADISLKSGYAWVEAVRALVRPVLTVLIWLIFILLFCTALAAKLSPVTANSVALTFVNTVAFAASTALAWWFGDRTPGSRPK